MKVQNNNIHYSYPYNTVNSNVTFRADLFNKKALKAANEALAESKIQNQNLLQYIKQLESIIAKVKTECEEFGKILSAEQSFSKKLLEIQNRLQSIVSVNQENKDLNIKQTEAGIIMSKTLL